MIHGDKGSFLQERTDEQENELVAGAIPVFGEDWTKPLTENDGILNYLNENAEPERVLTKSEPGNYMNYYQQIYEHIVFDEPLPSPGAEVIINMKLIEAAEESSKKGQVITFNDKNL